MLFLFHPVNGFRKPGQLYGFQQIIERVKLEGFDGVFIVSGRKNNLRGFAFDGLEQLKSITQTLLIVIFLLH